MNQVEKDFHYLAEEVWPWLQHLERNKQREQINNIPNTKPLKDRRGLEKFVP